MDNKITKSQTNSIRPHSLEAWMVFMRPKTFWVAATPVFVGTSFAMAYAGKFNFWTFILTLGGAVLIQAMSNMVNDYAYNLRKAENGTRVGLPRATTEGWVSMSAAKKMIATVIGLCVLFSILLICIGGWPIAVIAICSILAGYCYMAGPFPIAYTPLGEVLVFLFYGPVAVFGTYWLQTHSFSWPSLVPGCALGLYGAAVLFVNNYRDVDHDISVGRKTLPGLAGKKISYYLYCFMIYVPFIIVGWLTILGDQYWPMLFPLLILPNASRMVQKIKKATPETATSLMLETIRTELIFGLLLTVAGLMAFNLLWPVRVILSPSRIFAWPF